MRAPFSKPRASDAAARAAQQLPSLKADRQIAHGRRRAWGPRPLARVAAPSGRMSTRTTRCARTCTPV